MHEIKDILIIELQNNKINQLRSNKLGHFLTESTQVANLRLKIDTDVVYG
jgi:hypothetical protein